MMEYPFFSSKLRCSFGGVPFGIFGLSEHSWSGRPLKAVMDFRASWRCQLNDLATRKPGNKISPSTLCCWTLLFFPSPRGLFRRGSGKPFDSGELHRELTELISVSGSKTSSNILVSMRSGCTSVRWWASIWEVGHVLNTRAHLSAMVIDVDEQPDVDSGEWVRNKLKSPFQTNFVIGIRLTSSDSYRRVDSLQLSATSSVKFWHIRTINWTTSS